MHPFINTNDAWILKCQIVKAFSCCAQDVEHVWAKFPLLSSLFSPLSLLFSNRQKKKNWRERKKEEGRHRDCFDLIVFQNRKIQAERHHTETLTSQDI